MRTMRSWICSSMLTFFLLFVSFLLSSNIAYADDDSVVDEIDITVPVSCSLSGTGMDTHITELHNTESDSSIGESTITAYCNDLNGFSIYAVGFTNNEYGNNYLIDSNLPSTTNIATGTATSGNTSQWAMKLSPITNTNPAPTYPIIITGTTEDTDKTPTTLNYTSFQPVPSEYALVAKRKAATDVGTNAEGSSFKTTYQAYAASGQAAGTYEGQVKYTLIHPYHEIDSTRPNQYYVVHSGTGEIEVLPLSDDGNLTTKVADGFIYGGYYKSYGGVDSDAVNSLIAQYENGEVDDLTISSFKTYTAENMGELRNAWNIQDAYTEYGNAVGVEKGRVYYLKEVPESYLRPVFYSSYTKSNQIIGYYPTTIIDDLNYRKAGFIISPSDGEIGTEVYDHVNVRNADTGEIQDVLTPADISSQIVYGFITYFKYDGLIYNTPGETIQKAIIAFFVTPDALRVTGRQYVRATTEDSNNDGILDRDEYHGVRYSYSGQIKIHTGESSMPPLILSEDD